MRFVLTTDRSRRCPRSPNVVRVASRGDCRGVLCRPMALRPRHGGPAIIHDRGRSWQRKGGRVGVVKPAGILHLSPLTTFTSTTGARDSPRRTDLLLRRAASCFVRNSDRTIAMAYTSNLRAARDRLGQTVHPSRLQEGRGSVPEASGGGQLVRGREEGGVEHREGRGTTAGREDVGVDRSGEAVPELSLGNSWW